MSLLVKARRDGRSIVEVTPRSAGWKYVGFAAYRLEDRQTLELASDALERCLVVLHGTVTVRAGDETWREIGERASVFEDRSPYAVYAPRGTPASITSHTAAEIGVASAPGASAGTPRLIEPARMKRFSRGTGANTRYVCDILPESEPADRLLVVEVRTPSGHSSSYPPHKHDTDNPPDETSLEETYYHRLNPAQGFVFQRVYTDDRSLDESMAVEDRDVVMVPRGYHPVVVPYGYESYYLNVMAGPKRAWHFHNDPVHEWMLER